MCSYFYTVWFYSKFSLEILNWLILFLGLLILGCWIISTLFELYQYSSENHDSIQIPACAVLNQFNLHPKNVWIHFLDIVSIFIASDFDFYSIWIDSCSEWFDSCLLFWEKISSFHSHLIYHHTLFFLIYKINFQKYSKVSKLSLSTTSSNKRFS